MKLTSLFAAAALLVAAPVNAQQATMSQQPYDWQLTAICRIHTQGVADDAVCNHVRFSLSADSGNVSFGVGDPDNDTNATRIVFITDLVPDAKGHLPVTYVALVSNGRSTNGFVPLTGSCEYSPRGSEIINGKPSTMDFVTCAVSSDGNIMVAISSFGNGRLVAPIGRRMFRR